MALRDLIGITEHDFQQIIVGRNNKGLNELLKKANWTEIQELLAAGYDLNSNENYLIRQLALLNKFESVDYLMILGADIGAVEGYVLKKCAAAHNIDGVEYLIKKGLDVGIDANSALRQACSSAGPKQLKMVQLLIKNGANVHDMENQALINVCAGNGLAAGRWLFNQYEFDFETIKKAAEICLRYKNVQEWYEIFAEARFEFTKTDMLSCAVGGEETSRYNRAKALRYLNALNFSEDKRWQAIQKATKKADIVAFRTLVSAGFPIKKYAGSILEIAVVNNASHIVSDVMQKTNSWDLIEKIVENTRADRISNLVLSQISWLIVRHQHQKLSLENQRLGLSPSFNQSWKSAEKASNIDYLKTKPNGMRI